MRYIEVPIQIQQAGFHFFNPMCFFFFFFVGMNSVICCASIRFVTRDTFEIGTAGIVQSEIYMRLTHTPRTVSN